MIENFEAAAKSAKHQCDTHNALLKDCHLADPAGHASTMKADATHSGAKPKEGVGPVTANTSKVTEDQFMKIAPGVVRAELHLPKDATSKQVVDGMLKQEIALFKSANLQQEQSALKAFGFDDKQVSQFTHNKSRPGYDSQLAAAWLDKEKQYLDVTGPATEDTYKKIETGALKQAYQAARDAEKIRKFKAE
ncbi:MAG TPA: hypothetical protein V6C97_15120 [Oculatellaceae cyanobacterium]